MSNRVNVNINVNDNSRAGLAAVRRQMRQLQRDARRAGGDIRFNVQIPAGATRREIRRIRRELHGQRVTFNTTLNRPNPSPRTLRQRIQHILGRPITVPVRTTTRGVRNSLRSLGGLVSGTLQDGVGQGLIQGFKAGGPVGAAVLAAIVLGTLSLIGAALSGLIVTALGAAFVGVAGVSAAMSDEVKAHWSSTLARLKELFADVGTPLIPVLERALDTLEGMAERAAPALKRAVEETAPATEKFIQSLMKGFESFGKAAFGPIMEAWNVFAPVFGELWNEFMGELGSSFGEMADLVKEHPTEIAAALEIVFEAIELLVDTVTFFGKMWVFTLQNAGDAVGFLIQVLASLLNGALLVFEGILFGAEKAFGWVPGLGDKLRDGKESFSNFREGVIGALTDVANKAFGVDDALNNMNRKRKLDADISTWQSKLSRARADLKKTTNQKARAKLQADISDLQNKISRAKSQLAALNGRTATTYVRTVDLGIGAEAANAARRATGGVVGTAATGGIRGNLTMVGEQGPELLQLPTGSRVRSNPDTRRILGGSGGGGSEVVLRLEAGTDDVSRMLLHILRKAIRVQGGDVQLVLGR